MKVNIVYSELIKGAKDTATITATNHNETYSNLNNLLLEDFYADDIKQITELNGYILTGNKKMLDIDPLKNNIGIISNNSTGADGNFTSPVEVTINLNKTITSDGIMVYFPLGNNVLPRTFNIVWYDSNDAEITNKDFSPDFQWYYCENTVENFNKIKITFSNLNMPYQHLNLSNINFGKEYIIDETKTKDIKIIQEIDLISNELTANTLEFSFYSEDFGLLLNKKEKLKTIIDNRLNGIFFVDTFTRIEKNIFKVTAYDYIGLMEKTNTNGFMYDTNTADAHTTVSALISEHFKEYPMYIEPTFEDLIVSGYMKVTNKRDLLKQIAFSLNAYIDTSWTNKIMILSKTNFVSRQIPKNQILEGQNIETTDKVSNVNMYYYKFDRTSETVEIYKSDDAITENVTVMFNEPFYDLSISNGQILESNINYAIIKVEAGCILTGKKYNKIENKATETLNDSSFNNTKEIKDCYLISNLNWYQVLQNIKEHLNKTETINANIELLNSRLGDRVEVETTYSGIKTGHIVHTEINVYGGTRLWSNSKILLG